LILASGYEAKNFITKVVKNYLNIAEYDVIYKKESDIDESLKVDGIKFYKIDFSQYIKLEFFSKKRDYSKIIVIIKNKDEALKIYENLSNSNQNVAIEFAKFWDIELPKSDNIDVFDITDGVTNKLIDLLPNVPVYARNIGLGNGEIMEVQVPFSSKFVYRNVSNIQKRNYRIAAIYRNDDLILPQKNTIIQPNDKLIIFGKPNILKDLFKSIKEEKGTFPAPFGNNVYLFIDMKKMSQTTISKLLKSSIHLHRKTKNRKLIIKAINPTIENRLTKLQKFEDIDILIDYKNYNMEQIIENDIYEFNIGIMVVDNNFFKNNLNFLYSLKKPILKIGKNSIKKCNSSIILLQNEKNFENISPTIFDLSAQLNLQINFADIDPEENNSENVVNYFKNLSQIYYYKNVTFLESKNNPITELKTLNASCMFIPFNKKLPKNKFKAILNPNIEYSYLFLDNLNQFFVPIQ
jgi:hypothetical protein